MIPLRDVIPSRTRPVVTVGLIALNAAAFLHQQTLAPRELEVFVRTWGLVPAAFSPIDLLVSMFLHGGWMHFLGNMLYLWIFGDNVEDRFGHGRYLMFYLLCGVVAALLQTVFSPGSRVPMVGASGAIAGVLGAYLVMFPKSRILTLLPVFVFVQIIEVPALFFLGFWFLLQLLSGVGSLGQQADVGGVAFWAHAGGFAAGMAAVRFFRRPERLRVEWWDRV
jgi:membrane associated rhomboid family serine protease